MTTTITHELKRIGSYATTQGGVPCATEYVWICTCGANGRWTFDEDAARRGFRRHAASATDEGRADG